jgi:hypothetical protein
VVGTVPVLGVYILYWYQGEKKAFSKNWKLGSYLVLANFIAIYQSQLSVRKDEKFVRYLLPSNLVDRNSTG